MLDRRFFLFGACALGGCAKVRRAVFLKGIPARNVEEFSKYWGNVKERYAVTSVSESIMDLATGVLFEESSSQESVVDLSDAEFQALLLKIRSLVISSFERQSLSVRPNSELSLTSEPILFVDPALSSNISDRISNIESLIYRSRLSIAYGSVLDLDILERVRGSFSET